MIQFNKIFTGIGCDKRFGIDSVSTMIELYGTLTHPPPRSLGKTIRHGDRLIKSRQEKALDSRTLMNYRLPLEGLLSENFAENARWGSRRGSSGFLHAIPLQTHNVGGCKVYDPSGCNHFQDPPN